MNASKDMSGGSLPHQIGNEPQTIPGRPLRWRHVPGRYGEPEISGAIYSFGNGLGSISFDS